MDQFKKDDFCISMKCPFFNKKEKKCEIRRIYHTADCDYTAMQFLTWALSNNYVIAKSDHIEKDKRE